MYDPLEGLLFVKRGVYESLTPQSQDGWYREDRALHNASEVDDFFVINTA